VSATAADSSLLSLCGDTVEGGLTTPGYSDELAAPGVAGDTALYEDADAPPAAVLEEAPGAAGPEWPAAYGAAVGAKGFPP